VNIDTNRVYNCLKHFDFDSLFIEELGWNTHEHMIIFVDEGRTRSVWQWVRRQRGKQTAARE
jgi:hypothetical protein